MGQGRSLMATTMKWWKGFVWPAPQLSPSFSNPYTFPIYDLGNLLDLKPSFHASKIIDLLVGVIFGYCILISGQSHTLNSCLMNEPLTVGFCLLSTFMFPVWGVELREVMWERGKYLWELKWPAGSHCEDIPRVYTLYISGWPSLLMRNIVLCTVLEIKTQRIWGPASLER